MDYREYRMLVLILHSLCETCHREFRRSQNIARHKCQTTQSQGEEMLAIVWSTTSGGEHHPLDGSTVADK